MMLSKKSPYKQHINRQPGTTAHKTDNKQGQQPIPIIFQGT